MFELADPIDLARLPGLSICETHGSRVYLSGDRAYKLRKPVHFAFLDQSTVEQRERFARVEVELNRELAPSTYLGVRPATVEGRVEPVVEMRRFDEADTLACRLADGRVDPGMLERLGQRVAAFHLGATTQPGGGAATLLAAVHRNVAELAAELGEGLSAGELWRVARPLEAAALRQTATLDERAASGWWREGHGDLRADHVVFDEHGLQIVDRLEFDVGLRTHDVGDDLAFLLMDLESRGFRWAAEVVLGAYRDAGGDPGDPLLLATWAAQRALISTKVAMLRARQSPETHAAERARTLLAFAERLAWRTRPGRVYVVCGPPATGKSTLAETLSHRSGMRVVSSDIVRKRAQGLDPIEHAPAEAYSQARSAEVYRALGALAAEALATDDGVIVDATMGSLLMRGTFTDALHPAQQPVFVECRVPSVEAEHRARLRMRDATAVSDATPAIAARLAAAWEPLDEVAAAKHLVVRTDAPIGEVADEIERRLDAVALTADHLEDDLQTLEPPLSERPSASHQPPRPSNFTKASQ